MSKLDNNDDLLVKKAQGGNKKAFNILVIKYQNKVCNIISRYLNGDSHEIEDIAQETFIKAFRSLHNFRGDSAFYTWLYRIAINTTKNYLISNTKKNKKSDVTIDDAEVMDIPNLKEVENPENLLTTVELRNKVLSCINELSDELKTCITLREFDGLSYEEISDIVNCPVGTVRSRIFRAREFIEKSINNIG